jgi:hypothetical protein
MKVSYSLGRTLNTGNYESTRFDVSLELDTTEDNLEYDLERAKKFVVSQVEEEEAKWKL